MCTRSNGGSNNGLVHNGNCKAMSFFEHFLCVIVKHCVVLKIRFCKVWC